MHGRRARRAPSRPGRSPRRPGPRRRRGRSGGPPAGRRGRCRAGARRRSGVLRSRNSSAPASSSPSPCSASTGSPWPAGPRGRASGPSGAKTISAAARGGGPPSPCATKLTGKAASSAAKSRGRAARADAGETATTIPCCSVCMPPINAAEGRFSHAEGPSSAPRSFSDHVEPSQRHRPPAPDAPPAEQRGRRRRLRAPAQARGRRARAARQRPAADRRARTSCAPPRSPPAAGSCPRPLPHTPGEPLTVAWVTVPPSATSGGHTTMFRLVGGARARRPHLRPLPRRPPRLGHRAAPPQRSAPGGRGSAPRCATSRAGIEDAHAIFATSWQTAYPVLASPARGARCYCVAGLRAVLLPGRQRGAAGRGHLSLRLPRASPPARWLAQMLRRDYGMHADHFDFGCDLETYALDRSPGADGRRTGICYYCRPLDAAPRARARRRRRSTSSPPATPRSTSTSTASRRARCPSARSTTAS